MDSGLHQTSERRSQSLDSLRNVEQDSEPIRQTVKSEQTNRVERGEERGSKSEQQTKQKRLEDKRNRESAKPQEDGEIRKCRSGSREEKPNRLDLQKGKENSSENEEEPESELRHLEENLYMNEYKEDVAKRLVYKEKKRNERINMEDEQRSKKTSMNVDEDEKRSKKTSMSVNEDEKRSKKTSMNVNEDEKRNERTILKGCEDEDKNERTSKKGYETEPRRQRNSANVYEDENKNERSKKGYEDETRSQRTSVNVYEDEKNNGRVKNMKGYDDKQRISMTVYEDEKKNGTVNIKGDKQRISMTVYADEKRNELESIEAQCREGSGEELIVPAGDELDAGTSDRLKVSRSAALRASSFRQAMELNRVDSIVVKRSKVQVRREISEDPQESDAEEDSSELDDEAILSTYRPKLLPISDQNSSYLDDDSTENSDQQSPLRLGQRASYIAEKWSEICSAFGLPDENRGACDNSRHSSVSFLSTTFDSLPAEEVLMDITQESVVTEESCDSNKHQEMENGKTNKVISSGTDDAHQTVEDSSQAEESSQNTDAVKQFNGPSVEFVEQISSTTPKADSSAKVVVADPRGNRENRDALRNIFKEIEQYFPSESSHSNCNAAEYSNSGIPDHTDSEPAPLSDAALPVLKKSQSMKPPTLKPGRQRDVTLQRVRDGSARDDRKVRYSSSLPSLNGRVTSEMCDSSTHGSVVHAVAECPALVHSRKLSASDMTGYFSVSKVPTAGDCTSVLGLLSSVKLASEGLDQCRKSSNASDAGETEEQDATGQFEKSSEVHRISESSDMRDVRSGTSAATDAVFADSLPSPQPVDKCKNRGKLVFEKVSSPSVPDVGATSQHQDVRTEHQGHDEMKIETSNSNEFAAKSKQYRKGSERSDSLAGDSQIRSPSGSERLFEDIPYREVARRYDRQHTYVYRLARAYSSRVKQLQKEAALYQNTLKSSTRRPLRKWSTLDESTSDERKSSLSDVPRKDSSSIIPQNRNTVCLAENDLELSTATRSAFSLSCSPFLSTRNSNSASDSWRPVSESRVKARHRSSRTITKPFGLSFDGLPDLCFSGGNEDSDSEDCFDEAQETSMDTNLVKQRVRHFETHKESNC